LAFTGADEVSLFTRIPNLPSSARLEGAIRSQVILAKDTHGHTIRIAPPLVITSDQVDWALERIGATLRQDFA